MSVANTAPDLPKPLLAAAWMMGAAASFAAMAVAGRIIYRELDTFELMFYRSGIGFAIVMAVLARAPKGVGQVRSQQMGLHWQRNIVHFAGQNMWFYAVAVVPLAQVVAFEFTNPIWVAILAPLALGERWTRVRLLCIGLGFIGILIVARPGQVHLSIGHLSAAGCALGFALNTLYTKRIMRQDSVLCVLFWMTLLQTLFGFLLALPGGLTVPSMALMPWVGLIAVCGLTAHYCLTSALAAAPASVVAPMEFIRLPVLAIVGMLLYKEPLEIAVFVGAAVIVSANIINLAAARTRKTA